MPLLGKPLKKQEEEELGWGEAGVHGTQGLLLISFFKEALSL